MKLFIASQQDLAEAVERLGILPLFANSLTGFSVEEHVAPNGKVLLFVQPAVHMESSLSIRRLLSALHGLLNWRIIVVTAMILMHVGKMV